jgi:hypothetical protein
MFCTKGRFFDKSHKKSVLTLKKHKKYSSHKILIKINLTKNI